MYFFVHSGFCSCAVREESRQYLREIQLEYSRLLEELVNSGRYDTRDDFTVVLQPHHRDLEPVLDVTLCFLRVLYMHVAATYVALQNSIPLLQLMLKFSY